MGFNRFFIWVIGVAILFGIGSLLYLWFGDAIFQVYGGAAGMAILFLACDTVINEMGWW